MYKDLKGHSQIMWTIFLKFSPPMGLSEPYYPKYLYIDFLEPLSIPLPTGPHYFARTKVHYHLLIYK